MSNQNQTAIPKINLAALSPEDRARVQTFCRIMAIGLLRVEEDEAKEAMQAQKDTKIKRHRTSPVNLPA